MADILKAVNYNKKAAHRLGWYNELPWGARLDYPGLDLDPVEGTAEEKENFAKAVLAYQESADVSLSADGMLGMQTFSQLTEEYGDETVPVDWDVSGAVKYNNRYAESLGWYGNLPQAALSENLGWKKDPVHGTQYEKELFALETYQFQINQDLGPGDTDGKLGPNTWALIDSVYGDSNTAGKRHYVYKNRSLVASGASASLKVVAHDMADGLDLHKWGHFSTRAGHKPRLLVVHWGGIDPDHLFRVFSTPTRKVSSHGGAGRDVFYQFLDINHSSWHAGYVNKYSIGIDICQQPTVDWYNYYTSRGYDVSKTDNPARRPDGKVVGSSKILTLDPKIAEATRQVVFDMCELFEIPLKAPRGADGLAEEGEVWHGGFPRSVMDSGNFRGVVGHHHLSSRKWDMACWWGTIFDGTVLGD